MLLRNFFFRCTWGKYYIGGGGGVVLQVRTVNGGEAVLVKIITISH